MVIPNLGDTLSFGSYEKSKVGVVWEKERQGTARRHLNQGIFFI